MREAFRNNKAGLCDAISKRDFQIDIILVLRISQETEIRRIRYTAVERDLNDVMSKIISMV